MTSVIKPMGEIVTTMPVGATHPGMTAGPSFEVFYRSGYLLPHSRAAWILLHERLLELYGYLLQSIAQGAPRALEPIGDALLTLSRQLASNMSGLDERRIVVPPAWGLGAVSPD